MHVLLRGGEGERLRLRPDLEMILLHVGEGTIKVGFLEQLRPAVGTRRGASLAESVSQGKTRSHLRGYYRFLQGGERMFVVVCEEGDCLWSDGTLEIVLLQIDGRSVVLGCRPQTPRSRRTALMSSETSAVPLSHETAAPVGTGV